jgi:hypothetical protein
LTLQYPYQARPSKADFALWKDSIHRSLCVYRTDPSTQRVIIRSQLQPPGLVPLTSLIQSDYTDFIRAISGHIALSQKFNNLPHKFKAPIVITCPLPPLNTMVL